MVSDLDEVTAGRAMHVRGTVQMIHPRQQEDDILRDSPEHEHHAVCDRRRQGHYNDPNLIKVKHVIMCIINSNPRLINIKKYS